MAAQTHTNAEPCSAYKPVPPGASHGGGAHAPEPEPTVQEAPEYPGAHTHAQPPTAVYARCAPPGGTQVGGTVDAAATSHSMAAPETSARHRLPAVAVDSSDVQCQPAASYCSSCPAPHAGGTSAAIDACRFSRLSGGGGTGGGRDGGGCGGGRGGGGGGSGGGGGGRGGGGPGGRGEGGGLGGGGLAKAVCGICVTVAATLARLGLPDAASVRVRPPTDTALSKLLPMLAAVFAASGFITAMVTDSTALTFGGSDTPVLVTGRP